MVLPALIGQVVGSVLPSLTSAGGSSDADSLNVRGGNSTNNINLSTSGNVFFWAGVTFITAMIVFVVIKKV